MGKLIINVDKDTMQFYLSNDRILDFTFKDPVNVSNDLNVAELNNFLTLNTLKIKNCELILSYDGIITRQVEIPKIRQNDVKPFIMNNLDEYFTVNFNEYFFDYKIVDKSGTNYQLLLCAVQKVRLHGVINLLKAVGIKVTIVSVYPDMIHRLFQGSEKSAAVIDVKRNKTNITIVEKTGVFLYSVVDNDFTDDESIRAYADSISYFLNFFATRHYGRSADEVYLIGDVDDSVAKAMELHMGVRLNREINYNGILIKDNPVFIRTKSKLSDKKIDFFKIIDEGNQARIILKPVCYGAGITAILLILSMLTTGILLSRYNNVKLDDQIKKYEYLDAEYKRLDEEKAVYTYRTKLIEGIKNDEFKYRDVLASIKGGLPSTVKVSSLTIDRKVVEVTFDIPQNKTMDVAQLVVSLNKIGIFETVEAEKVSLNDDVKSISFKMILKK